MLSGPVFRTLQLRSPRIKRLVQQEDIGVVWLQVHFQNRTRGNWEVYKIRRWRWILIFYTAGVSAKVGGSGQ